ncbi:MAG: carotenoid biosynthesis protein [Bacteroidales bacterium]|nr:carotenoid biosynthesis protein [Bacteroidales bacterium]
MEFSLTKEGHVKRFFIIFYLVGTAGLLISYTYPLFVKLIPYSLLLNFIYLMYFHTKLSYKSISGFLLVFLLGLVVEIAGVNTGNIFGTYIYGKSLGIQVFNTPLIIGLNWLFLVYITSSLLEKPKMHVLLKIAIASLIMVVIDMILEQVAPKMDMWYFVNGKVPLRNYIAWYCTAFVMHGIVKWLKIDTRNSLAGLLMTCQFFFFIILSIFLK